ncbi:dicarboxylate/amino acid:cation symporter [Pseudanabaena sp. FACHB-1277]|uniref:Dicarboxylate/amino acid:cation symporter n=1 Tax=Pseudanabaena cinerea FACHB-1277 TaxID=2949581 RepID=A0A926Z531_9CYAN|nr:dicarboxylate/amino acid:cation symporter [Pseudanabaena cinerea]MBD2149841.1 dicarboxylate/amino acid:cation symporter [Pseudanabaena cinerea FACHB-1277]
MNLSTLILLSLGLGIGFGAILNTTFPTYIELINLNILVPVGESFLRLIQFVVVPIVFSSLIMGLTRIQGAGQVGRYTAKLVTSYVITSTIALGVGMATAYLLQPGSGVEGFALPESLEVTVAPSLVTWLVSLIPTNPLEALSTGNLLQIIFSAVLLGFGIQLAHEQAQPFVKLIESIYHISEKTLSVILYVAPLGVFALISSVIAVQGLELIAKLFLYVLGLFIASTIMIAIDMLILATLKADPLRFLRSLAEAIALAFGTASSNAALPVVLQNIQENYGLREEIASFAIPLGTALKRDGAAILQGFNALFVTQIYQVPLTPSLLLAIALSSLLVSFSTPGVPGSAIITMATVLSAAGLPLEAIALVAGIDRLTDGFKTVVNIIGNSTNAIILSHWESEVLTDTIAT